MPRVDRRVPSRQLLLRPLAWLQLLDAHRQLPIQDVLLHVRLSLVALGPLVLDIVEALLFVGAAELGEGGAVDDRRQVLHGEIGEDDLLLLGIQRDLGRLLLHLDLLRLLRLLFLLTPQLRLTLPAGALVLLLLQQALLLVLLIDQLGLELTTRRLRSSLFLPLLVLLGPLVLLPPPFQGRGSRGCCPNRRRVKLHGVRREVAGAAGGTAGEEIHGCKR
mmetsp:Transcript_91491/g.232749  ORF Transcript_91491/g.232749 Transcript_91491/m.232749 type:complete len:219 (-) Transcript_91491:33-689(-)